MELTGIVWNAFWQSFAPKNVEKLRENIEKLREHVGVGGMAEPLNLTIVSEFQVFSIAFPSVVVGPDVLYAFKRCNCRFSTLYLVTLNAKTW